MEGAQANQSVRATGRSGNLAVIVLLVVIALLLGTQTYFDVQAHLQRRAVAEHVTETIAELEKQRKEPFAEYVKDLQSEETKSVYHQMYHANNAQLKLANLMVQENQLILALLAGKR